MARAHDASPIAQPDDERLRLLLSIEQQLQDQVRRAREQAAQRVREARAAADQRIAAAREAAARADADLARPERVALDAALATIDAAHRDALATIARISDDRVDELARWALAQVIGSRGGQA